MSKCFRCGYCCVFYDVMVIRPSAVRRIKDIDDLSEGDIFHKKGGEPCPHLEYDGDEAVCAIHEYEWFQDTPCGRHQAGLIIGECLLGEAMREKTMCDLPRFVLIWDDEAEKLEIQNGRDNETEG